VITDYLLELLDELRVPTRRRRRILAEVEDHLTCAAAELHAGGLDVGDAEREAARRFGPANQVARAFVEQEAALGGKRAARASGLLAALLAVFMLAPPGVVLRDHGFPAGLVMFVLAQVALVAGGLTLVRAWGAASEGGPRGPRLFLILRGGLVVVACAAGAMTYGIADALTTSAGPHGTLTAWLGLAGVALGATATAATLAKGWRGASVAGMASLAGSPEDADALADFRAVAVLMLTRLQRRAPMLDAIVGHAAALPPACSVVAQPRALHDSAWLDLRRHPWRCALTVATLAGVALAGWHALVEGVNVPHLPGAVLAAALIATIEALAALLGFAVLGRFLGIRSPRAKD
jgi:hypothetical protein